MQGVTTGYKVGLPSDRVRVTQPLSVIRESVRVSKLILGGSDVIVDVIEGTSVVAPVDDKSDPLLVKSAVELENDEGDDVSEGLEDAMLDIVDVNKAVAFDGAVVDETVGEFVDVESVSLGEAKLMEDTEILDSVVVPLSVDGKVMLSSSAEDVAGLIESSELLE